MIWEKVNSEYGNHLARAAVFGGWLVMSTDEVLAFAGENSFKSMEPGYQWRTSITFVPDPNHEWSLTKEY